MIVRRAKDFIKRRPRLYRLALQAYKKVNPRIVAEERFRRRCAVRFGANPRITINVGGQQCQYEAISAKNYWHLAIGNNESHPYFDQYLFAGDTVLDIGGHVGAWTIPYSKHVGPAGHVYVFEPDPTGYQAIRKNLTLNGCANVTAFNWAIAGENGRVKFFIRPEKDTHSVFEKTCAPSLTGRQIELETEVHTVDSLVEAGVVRQPDFIKLDIEGAELLALEGMRATLSRARAIYVECHEALQLDLGLGDPVEVVSRKLQELGVRKIIQTDVSHVLGIM